MNILSFDEWLQADGYYEGIDDMIYALSLCNDLNEWDIIDRIKFEITRFNDYVVSSRNA